MAHDENPDSGRDTAKAAATGVPIALLAAGRSSRMGAGRSKLLARIDGVPLVRRSALVALASGASPVIVVLGHRADELRAHLADLPVTLVVNADFASGLSSSLRLAVGHVAAEARGLLVHLADMPAITAADLRGLLDAFEADGGRSVVRAVAGGRRGNPVILPRALFGAVAALSGDVGARQAIANSGLPVIDVELGDAAAIDVDTPEALAAAGGVWPD